MKEAVSSQAASVMIENIEPSTNNEQEMLLGKPRPICLGCKDAAGIEAVQKDLQLEREKTAQLESIIMALASKLETYRHLAKNVLDLEAKVSVFLLYRSSLIGHL